MYCSNCGLKINKKQIDKALESDFKNANNIKYLYNSLVATKKFAFKEKANQLKEENKENYKEEVIKLKEELNNEILDLKAKLKANDLEFFKSALHVSEKRDLNTKDYYVCPRCGKLVRTDLNEKDIKSLARAAHSEIHRGRNNISSGMCGLMIGAILAIIGFMFFALSFKATNGGILDTTCVEFYVFIVLVLIGVALITYAIINIIYGREKIHNYENLLRNINNDAFHQ